VPSGQSGRTSKGCAPFFYEFTPHFTLQYILRRFSAAWLTATLQLALRLFLSRKETFFMETTGNGLIKDQEIIKSPHINWDFPQPRSGITGSLDKFFGPGTTKAEAWVEGVACIGAGITMPIFAYLNGFNWSFLQYILATLLAFDMVGGIVTNATSSAKRWYHRPGQGFKQHYSFIALHVAYLFLVALLFRSMDWTYFGMLSFGLLLTAFIVLRAPLYLRRPLAFGMIVIALLVNSYGFSPTVGLEWFVPFLFIKLIASHALREEPYRPERRNESATS
jgi:hypothetical protein